MAIRAGWPVDREERLAGNYSRVRSFHSSIPKRDTDDFGRRAVTPGTGDAGAGIKDRAQRVVYRVPSPGAITRDLLPLTYFPAPEPDRPRWKPGRCSEFNA